MAEKKKKLSDLDELSWTRWLASPLLEQRLGSPLTGALAQGVHSFATIPQRAIESAGSLQRGGSYDPGPVLEATGLIMGGTPFSAPRGALGAGFTSPAAKKYDPEMLKALEAAGVKPGKALGGPVTYQYPSVGVPKPMTPFPAHKPVDPVESALETIKKGLETESKGLRSDLKYNRLTAKMAEHLEPLDWSALRSPHATPESRGIPAHAAGLGFNPEYPLFKGGSRRSLTRERLEIPEEKSYERGLFFADDPAIADWYGNVAQYVSRAKNPVQVDWQKATGLKEYYSGPMDAIVEAARKKKHDVLLVKGIIDAGSEGVNPQNQIIVLDPKVLRRPQAAFDPAKIDINNLLAGIGGAVAAPGLAGLPLIDDRRRSNAAP